MKRKRWSHQYFIGTTTGWVRARAFGTLYGAIQAAKALRRSGCRRLIVVSDGTFDCWDTVAYVGKSHELVRPLLIGSAQD
jgi:hypothetical protein